MARLTTIVELREIKDINLTPLIDLTFLLLITFIITFPLIEQGIPIELPRVSAEDFEDVFAFTLTLDREGDVYLDDIRMEEAELLGAMQRVRASHPDAVVRLRADEQIAYGRLAAILRTLRRAELFRVALVMQEE